MAKARIRISTTVANGFGFVEYANLETGQKISRPVFVAEVRVLEVEPAEAERLWRELLWEESEDGRAAARLDDGSFEG